jgi:hypothetical protein
MPIDLTFIYTTGLKGLFYLMLLIFTINGAFLGFHWYAYGENRSTSTIALATYLTGGALLLLVIAGSISLL